MNPYLRIGSAIVLLALAAYVTSVSGQVRRRKATDMVLRFLVAGVCLDILATAFMIAGSSRGLFTTHGILGYSALGAMLGDLVLVGVFRARRGAEARLPGWLHAYSVAALAWWVIAFLLGALLALRMLRLG